MKYFCLYCYEADIEDSEAVKTWYCGWAINLHHFNQRRQEPICEIYAFMPVSNMNEEQTYLGSTDDKAKSN